MEVNLNVAVLSAACSLLISIILVVHFLGRESKRNSIVSTEQSFDGHFKPVPDTEAIINYLRNTDLPTASMLFALPVGRLKFFLDSPREFKSIVIVRHCYQRLLLIIESCRANNRQGIIFTGPQRNGKVLCCNFINIVFVSY